MSDIGKFIQQLRSIALQSLARMYRPEEGLFAFRLRMDDGKDILEGMSRRYTAISLIGLSEQNDDIAIDVLAGDEPQDVCSNLLSKIDCCEDIGEAALTVWAARALNHPDVSKAIGRLKYMDPVRGSYPTVELAWALTALVINGGNNTDLSLADAIAQRLIRSFRKESALFPHQPVGARSSLLRSHITCFADLVYPIQAMSYYYRATGNPEAAEVARQCAKRMCELQGPHGQWWWHYDVRTGRVVERFPVYAVHQDSMAPMALLAIQAFTGEDKLDAIEKGLRWLIDPPEIEGSLIDTESGVIWRKIARHEPGKTVRGIQAVASRLCSSFRVPAMDLIFRPGLVDYESRPYHMGWILHAWSEDRAMELPGR